MPKVGTPDGTMVIPFGKYKDQTIEDVPTSYLRWMVANLDDDKEDLIHAAEAEIEWRDQFGK